MREGGGLEDKLGLAAGPFPEAALGLIGGREGPPHAARQARLGVSLVLRVPRARPEQGGQGRGAAWAGGPQTAGAASGWRRGSCRQ